MRYEMGKQEREARSTGVVGGGGTKAVAAPGSPGPKARELQVAGHAIGIAKRQTSPFSRTT
jgi:hypothetical protein